MTQKIHISAVLVFILIFTFCGCTSKTLRLSEVKYIPQTDGLYGGSFLIKEWMYKGTKNDHHYFRYTYTVENFPKHIEYKIPVSELIIPFEMAYSRNMRDWIQVKRPSKSPVKQFARMASPFPEPYIPEPVRMVK